MATISGEALIISNPVVSILSGAPEKYKLYNMGGSEFNKTNLQASFNFSTKLNVKFGYTKCSVLDVATKQTSGTGENLLTVQYWG